MYCVRRGENLSRHNVFSWGFGSLLAGTALGFFLFGSPQTVSAAYPPYDNPPGYLYARDYDDDDD